MRVLSLAGDAAFFGSGFTTVAHGLVVEDIPQTVKLERVDGGELAKDGVLAGKQERRVAHALHTAGRDNTPVAALNALSSEHDGLHAAGTDLVDGGGIGA